MDKLKVFEMSAFSPRKSSTGIPGNYCTEASSMGFKPGEWPESFKVRAYYGRVVTMKRVRPIMGMGELIAVEYDSCGDGLLNIHVLND